MTEIKRYTAPCKINLGLEVLYKRGDGYHELNTLFYRVLEPHDSVVVTPSEFFRLTCSDPTLPIDSRNLMMRAANAFQKLTEKPLPPIHVHLEKHIPTGAGLGGGSSDAAIMLQILSDRSEVAPYRKDLIHLATQIGADVPFFLAGDKAAMARGIGEKLTPLDFDLSAFVLIVMDPEIHVSTKDAYASLSPNPSPRNTDFESLFEETPPLSQLKEELSNDFEPEIFRQHPKLARLKHAMYARGAGFALMSGSGSAIFGLFDDGPKAKEAKAAFETEGLKAWLS
jgi:4-diphosphocytidyl-2-C-methyl-D-erythritol kinase